MVSILHSDASETALEYGVDYTVNDLSVSLTTPAQVGEHIIVYRQTSTDKIVTWNDGSILLARDMNTEDAQMLHLQEEQQDYIMAHAISTKVTSDKEVLWDALNHRVINVSDPKDPQDAVTKNYMENVQGGFVSANTILVQEATKQASAAKSSQEAAKASETNAHTSETNSEISHQKAKKWAEATDSPDGEADTDSTTGKTQSSKEWALYSKTKAQEAATSATNAKSSETNAKASETNAKTSETNAKISETKAAVSEANAKSSETKSKDSENAARVSEQNAAESAQIATEYGGDFNMWKRNKEYTVGDIAYSPHLPSWAYLECTTAGTTGVSEPYYIEGYTEIEDGSAVFKVRNITELVNNLEDLQVKNTQLANQLVSLTTPQKIDVSYNSTYIVDVKVYKVGHLVWGHFSALKSDTAPDIPIITNMPRAKETWGAIITPFNMHNNEGKALRITMNANDTVLNLHYSQTWEQTPGNEAEITFMYITSE